MSKKAGLIFMEMNVIGIRNEMIVCLQGLFECLINGAEKHH